MASFDTRGDHPLCRALGSVIRPNIQRCACASGPPIRSVASRCASCIEPRLSPSEQDGVFATEPVPGTDSGENRCTARYDGVASGGPAACDGGVPGEAAMAKRIKLPESCGRVVRHAFSTITPGKPSDLRGCPKVAPKLPRNCRIIALGAEIRPNLRQTWPMWDEFGAESWAPQLAKVGPDSAEVDTNISPK